MTTGKAPAVRKFALSYQGFAQAVSGYLSVCKAPFGGTITGATFMSAGDITGHATARRDLNLYRGTPDGSLGGNALTLDFVAGVNAEPQHEIAFNVTGALVHRQVEKGDYIHFHSEAVGAGVADPGGLIIVELTRDPDAE